MDVIVKVGQVAESHPEAKAVDMVARFAAVGVEVFAHRADGAELQLSPDGARLVPWAEVDWI